MDDVKDRAANLIPCMVADRYFPVFLIWDSHWWSSYNEQKLYVLDGRFKKSFKLTSPFDYITDIGVGLIRAPVVYFEQGTWFLEPEVSGKEFKMEEYTKSSGTAIYEQTKGRVGMTNNVLIGKDRKAVDERGGALKDHLLYLVTLPVRLLSIPFVVSIGKEAWENMVRRTRNSVRHPYDFQSELIPKDKEKFYKRVRKRTPIGTGYFSRFFKELEICRESVDECGRNKTRKIRPVFSEKLSGKRCMNV